MKTFVGMLVLCLAVLAGVVLAQDKPAQEKPTIDPQNPLTSWNKVAYTRVDTVRSYAQIVGHVADAQYLFCSIALGEKNPAPDMHVVDRQRTELPRV
jgi:hypothetical protein